jgi:hypothetical protein
MKVLKGSEVLHETNQSVCHKYLFARQSAHYAIQQGHAA